MSNADEDRGEAHAIVGLRLDIVGSQAISQSGSEVFDLVSHAPLLLTSAKTYYPSGLVLLDEQHLDSKLDLWLVPPK